MNVERRLKDERSTPVRRSFNEGGPNFERPILNQKTKSSFTLKPYLLFIFLFSFTIRCWALTVPRSFFIPHLPHPVLLPQVGKALIWQLWLISTVSGVTDHPKGDKVLIIS
jgi:hypothetical protein